ncbi:hypothetical protein KGP24_23325 (plasmid) [Enterobacter sp. JBIWA008]|uniref:hypothetical protein n=1 Tax=Enterobacter sp. JBIWA008 TaxID=2831892 RepID=UPI001CBA9592|nr:hypothetical protein [Enterobacter sp. JBIWA008]UAN43333.1 hypothetical protein KGP24_23325 [Enterobacter sp. JBIWA008]
MNKLTKYLASGMAVIMLPFSAAIAAEASTVATAQENIVVNTTGQVTLSLTPVTTLLASTYQSGTKVADWDASATAGTVAFRLNPTIMKTNGNVGTGVATSTTNSNNTISLTIFLYLSEKCNWSNTTVDSGWAVCPQGQSTLRGTINTINNQTIAVGTYPLSVDAAVWQF